MTFPKMSLDELKRRYLERTLTANAIGAPGSQDVTVTNTVTSPVPVDITDVDMNLLAKEATLVALLNANDEVDTLLRAIRDEQQRRTDPLAAGQAFIGFTGFAEDIAAKQGRYRFAGGKVTTSVVSPNASLTLTNPAESGVDLLLMRYQVEVDAAADVVILLDAISAGTISSNYNPNQRTELPNPGQVRVGAGVLTGGVTQSVIRRAQPNSPVAVGPFRFRIPPGKTWTVRFLGPGATNTVWFNIGWVVVPENGDL